MRNCFDLAFAIDCVVYRTEGQLLICDLVKCVSTWC